MPYIPIAFDIFKLPYHEGFLAFKENVVQTHQQNDKMSFLSPFGGSYVS